MWMSARSKESPGIPSSEVVQKKKRDYVDLSDLKLVGSNNDLYYNY